MDTGKRVREVREVRDGKETNGRRKAGVRGAGTGERVAGAWGGLVEREGDKRAEGHGNEVDAPKGLSVRVEEELGLEPPSRDCTCREWRVSKGTDRR